MLGDNQSGIRCLFTEDDSTWGIMEVTNQTSMRLDQHLN